MKTKILLILFASFLSGQIFSQTIVSTKPSKKNVILEEYTGIHCYYCPDGHKRANELIHENPGRVFSINIHEGGYAVPGDGEPDFRTQWGDALAGQTGLVGYPTGTINRRAFGDAKVTAVSRVYWSDYAKIIMNEDSPVNIAVSAKMVPDTSRNLEVLVEVYYTDMDAVSNDFTHRINVALLQDTVKGPQTGASDNYPELIIDGVYRHNHMLRHLLTGQWGEEILISRGPFFSKTYTYTIPSKINDVDLILKNIKVVAFITQTKQNILTGAEAINIGNPNGIRENNNIFSSINIFPNPVKDQFTLSLNTTLPSVVNVKIYNIVGETLYNKSYNANGVLNKNISVNNFKSGIYFIEVSSDSQNEIQKIIVQ